MDNDMDSTVSGFSMVSISGQSEEISAEKAVDEGFKTMQTTLNEIHSYLRRVLMADNRGDTSQ